MLNFSSSLSLKHPSMLSSFLFFASRTFSVHCYSVSCFTAGCASFNSKSLIVMSSFSLGLLGWLILSCSKNVTIRFARRTDVMPPVPMETKYHPSAVDLLLIKRLIAETSKQNLLQFLQHEFVNIGKSHAERLIGKRPCWQKVFLHMLLVLLKSGLVNHMMYGKGLSSSATQ